jgi:hypothetical protein
MRPPVVGKAPSPSDAKRPALLSACNATESVIKFTRHDPSNPLPLVLPVGYWRFGVLVDLRSPAR